MKRVLLLSSLAVAGRAQQTAMDPAGAPARSIAHLGLFFLALLTAIYIVVITFALLPLMRRHRGIDQEPLEGNHRPSDATETRMAKRIGLATVATILILFGLITVSVSTSKATSGSPPRPDSLVVEITATQWWWSVRYANNDASRIVMAANEMHIPVGRPVMIRGTSTDVIHSFWVPNLQGKRDLIPSRTNIDWIQADRPGRYRGQCAEFCGLQHAHMALWVVAEPPDRFEEWYSRQLQPAADPADPVRQRGQQVFMDYACVLCHTIQGTQAAGQVGPDLTHLASRLTIAAGTLPNNKGNLAGWITDPQSIKPGNHMATVPIRPEDMQPLLEYLESLQ
ncbi:MAG: cytochrome c oxidase subunit [Bryobacterales bacterium]|jgi:cytochrome c oxidase subunit 2|nr:cytochrome c oxidase subunit [Bryobacterales bacterium]